MVNMVVQVETARPAVIYTHNADVCVFRFAASFRIDAVWGWAVLDGLVHQKHQQGQQV